MSRPARVERAPDTSIAVAALLSDHVAHEAASEALAGCTATIAHVAAETYSVLTRLPPPHRVEATTAAEALAKRLPPVHLTLDAGNCTMAPKRLAVAGVSGGATYDGLIALTAIAHGAELVSRDWRAARAYRALGARFKLIE